MSKSLNQFFLGGLSLSAVNISGKIVNLLILPIITLYLSPSDFGVIAVYMLIISVLSMIYNPGIISVTLRLYYDHDDSSEENRLLIGSSVFFLVVFPILIVLISVLFQDRIFNLFFKDFNFWPYGFFAVLASITPQVVRLWSTLWVAKNKTSKVAIVSLIRIILAITISLVLVVVYEMKAMGRILGLFLGNLLIFGVAMHDIIKYTKFNFSFKVLWQTLVLGFPLLFSVFSYVIMESSDKYMLEKMVGLSDLGIYDIAYTYSAIPLFLIVGFSQVWQPVFFENMKKEAKEILRKLSNYYVTFFFIISFTVIIFSNEVFNVFVNKEYIKAIEIIPWVVIGVFFLGLSNLIVSIYSYQKRFKEVGGIAIAVAFINIIANYFFIKNYGVIGAAIGSAFTYVIYFLTLFIRVRKDFSNIFSYKVFFLALLLLAFTFIVFVYLNSNYSQFNIIHTCIKLVTLFSLFLGLFYIVVSSKDRMSLIQLLKDKLWRRKRY